MKKSLSRLAVVEAVVLRVYPIANKDALKLARLQSAGEHFGEALAVLRSRQSDEIIGRAGYDNRFFAFENKSARRGVGRTIHHSERGSP